MELIHGFGSTGTSSYGFVLGAIISFSSYYYWVHRQWADTDFLDALAPASAFGIGLVRIGCFYAGCCFGTLSDLPWSVRFGSDSPAFAYQMAEGLILPADSLTLPIHPVQLYESIISLTGFALILVLSRIKTQSSSKESVPGKSSQSNDRQDACPTLAPLGWLPVQRYELFLGWIAYYGIWRMVSVSFRAGSGHFLAIDQAIWAVSTALAIAVIIVRRLLRTSPELA